MLLFLILLLGFSSAEDQPQLGYIPLDGACELSAQCQRNAVCDMSLKRCVCKEHFEQHQGNCLALLDLSCSNNKQCPGTSICLPQAMKCACILDYVPNHIMTTCLTDTFPEPLVPYGADCSRTEDCQWNQLDVEGRVQDSRATCAAYPLYKPLSQLVLIICLYFIYQRVLDLFR
ncbi:uncharacterized protein LOC135438953 [Drosophila montana]|uniref:uncharacterized protein LOC135438953 n=1 Tax=Drosophila montana TaxID=40370 RepID=UPI00313D9DD5